MAGLQSLIGKMRLRGGQRSAIGDWLVILLAALSMVLFVNLIWVLAAPVGSVGNWRMRTPLALPAATRTALFSTFDPFARTATQAEGQVVVTSLSLTLFGTRANEISGGGSAILAGADGIQQSFGVGEEVMPGVVLSQVAFDHVVLSRNGVNESLFLDQSVPAEKVGEADPQAGPATPASSAGDGVVKLNAATLRDSIGAAPRTENGRVTGLILNAKDDGVMLRNAGLAAGDILVSINGRPVGAASDVATQLRPGAQLTLEVERGSQKIPVGLNLE